MKNQRLIILLIIIALIISGGVFYFSYFSKPQIAVNSNKANFNYLSCGSHDDCTTTRYPLHNCCMDCDIFPINKEGMKLQKEWRNNNCTAQESLCPTYKCLWPDKDVLCIQNKCVLRSKEGNACNVDETCQDIDCSQYDQPVKNSYRPLCVENKCKCMCPGCE